MKFWIEGRGMIREWPEGIRFEDAVTTDSLGRRHPQAETWVPVCGGNWGHVGSERCALDLGKAPSGWLPGIPVKSRRGKEK